MDRSGRRRRLVIAAGAAVGVLVVGALSLLVAGLLGASPVPLPGLPDLGGPAPAPATTNTRPGTDRTTTGAASTPTPNPSAAPTATPDPTRRHVPTQTPTYHGPPSRS